MSDSEKKDQLDEETQLESPEVVDCPEIFDEINEIGEDYRAAGLLMTLPDIYHAAIMNLCQGSPKAMLCCIKIYNDMGVTGLEIVFSMNVFRKPGKKNSLFQELELLHKLLAKIGDACKGVDVNKLILQMVKSQMDVRVEALVIKSMDSIVRMYDYAAFLGLKSEMFAMDWSWGEFEVFVMNFDHLRQTNLVLAYQYFRSYVTPDFVGNGSKKN